MTDVPFEKFKSIARLSRECVITEKIDGCNAQVYMGEDGVVLAGSRNLWLTPEADHYGFAGWVKAHETELREKLGPGRHYGEWWGVGIQGGYGLYERRFSLFNTSLWTPENPPPPCCSVVPVLYTGDFDTEAIEAWLDVLRRDGSRAAPGWMKAEGIVVFHKAAQTFFKKTLGGDGHKGTPGHRKAA